MALDPTTLQVKLSYPDAAFLKICTMRNLAAVPKAVIAKYNQQWTQPEHMVTSGAYRLKEHVINGYILAVQNPYYYEKVAIPQVKYLPLVDTSTAGATYKSGALDMTYQAVPKDDLQSLQHSLPKELYTVSQEGIVYYDINQALP